MTLNLIQKLIELGERDGSGFKMEKDTTGLAQMRLSIGEIGWLTVAPLTDDQLMEALIKFSVYVETKEQKKQ